MLNKMVKDSASGGTVKARRSAWRADRRDYGLFRALAGVAVKVAAVRITTSWNA
jgi:hypothetical protein